MIRVKMLKRNEVAVVDNGKVYKFDLGGKCIGEDIGGISENMEGSIDLPLISVLSSNGVLDIGVSTGHNEFKRYSCDMDAMTCAITLQSLGGFVRMLRRDGKCKDTLFNQLIFIYKEGTDLAPLLLGINAKEV